MRHLLLVNPKAGKSDQSAAIAQAAADTFGRRSLDWAVATTQGPGHAAALAREAAQTSGPLRIYACGGDGTLNEVVNGAAGFGHVAVTHIPTGSGNDFLKCFGGDASRFRSLDQFLECEETPLDLIDCNGRLAVNICSVGFDARVGLGMASFKRLPFVSGPMAYKLSLAGNFIRGIHRPYQVSVGGHTYSGNFSLICVCNGRYYGGGFYPAPFADPTDGALEFLLVKGVSRLTVARVVDHYAKGRGAEFPQYITLLRGQSITVRCDRPSMVNVDGERLDGETLTFSRSPHTLRFFYPKGAAIAPAAPDPKFEILQYLEK